MTAEEKRDRGKRRLEALRNEHGELVMLQMVMGLTSGMLNHIAPTQLDARKLQRFVGAMSDDEWQLGVGMTVELIKSGDGDA